MKIFPLRCAFIVFVATTISAPATTYFVDLNSLNPAPPYADWNTAATNIQDAVDLAMPGDLVLVTNGVYQIGEHTDSTGQSNRVVVTKALTLQSVNGPAETHIVGVRPTAPPLSRRVRCVYLAAGATLSGFTLTNGAASNGGGVLCESVTAVVSNCVMSGNLAGNYGGGAYGGTVIASDFIKNGASSGGGGAASNLVLQSTFLENGAFRGGAVYGSQVQHSLLLTNSAIGGSGGPSAEAGGAYQAQLNNCLLVGNHADIVGGASQSALVNCTIVANVGGLASGVMSCRLTNSIVYYNFGLSSAQHSGSTFWHCNVTNPVVTGGNNNNFWVVPGFVNPAANDFRLRPDSPNINSGYNPAVAPTDLDGHPRVMGGSVDLGAYEYQTPTSNLSYYWAGLFGLPLDGSADGLDPDGDGLNNMAEWRAGTSPNNALSTLRMENVTKLTDRAIVRWQSIRTRFYWLERTTNPGTAAFETIATQIPGSGGTQMYHDLTAANGESYFYRVGVH